MFVILANSHLIIVSLSFFPSPSYVFLLSFSALHRGPTRGWREGVIGLFFGREGVIAKKNGREGVIEETKA